MLKSVPGCLVLTAYCLLVPDEYQATREAFLEQINAARAAAGAHPLILSPALSAVAQERAERIARGPLPAAPAAEEASRRALAHGYEAWVLSEVFAEADGDVASVVGRWREPGGTPAAEILGTSYREMGLGVVLSRDVPLYVVLLSLSWDNFFRDATQAFQDQESWRRQMLAAVNKERAARRLAPLRRQPQLDEAAQAHADDMLRRGYYSHDTPEGKNALERIKARGYRAGEAAENIARGQYSIDEVVRGWMESPVHRKHLLSPKFAHAGFGLAFGRNPRGYEILWVQNFARTSEPARFAGQSKFLNF